MFKEREGDRLNWEMRKAAEDVVSPPSRKKVFLYRYLGSKLHRLLVKEDLLAAKNAALPYAQQLADLMPYFTPEGGAPEDLRPRAADSLSDTAAATAVHKAYGPKRNT